MLVAGSNIVVQSKYKHYLDLDTGQNSLLTVSMTLLSSPNLPQMLPPIDITVKTNMDDLTIKQWTKKTRKIGKK